MFDAPWEQMVPFPAGALLSRDKGYFLNKLTGPASDTSTLPQVHPPIHIIVDNGNVTLDGVLANSMDRAKAEADARVAGTHFNFTNNLRLEAESK
jgi:hypothetical protein